MALKATIFKATLHIADMDKHYYGDHHLTVARHPSETDERMMIRLLAFALNANDTLEFTKGLSSDDEPELWQKSLSDEIELWIELGLPDEDRIRKACNRSKQVILYTYGGRAVPVWWEKHHNKLTRFGNLTVVELPADPIAELATLAERSMTLQVSIQDGEVTFSNDASLVSITPEQRLPQQ
ncbi:MAG: YaeQ family protein [Gammaproteobacteria bacterium]|uniref:YaeQ protein n=1 Tax=Marinobacter litoralis TaxID=187981 RepID=A0A3M2RBK1_9GAMM|nr:YaeQ family protein [Marinobacter litoralis]MBR9869911.1 YaeQ family protein [Gammaproteobacteria bacterium]RMJ02651.1 YaeQ protein [Marinobacter litoralis]